MKKTLTTLCLLSVSFGWIGTVSAEITNPYTIDEKSQVMFGDSVSVSGHEGLENYTYEYVGSYLHITYTYTHSALTVSDYPPLLYITNVDPRTTATPTERTTDEVYTLQAVTDATDWYSYDVQFDATGYTVVVKQTGTITILNTHRNVTGLTSTDYVSLANLYQQSPSTQFSMSFTPRTVYQAPAASSSSSSNSSASVYSPSTRNGERARCVETSTGLYCPTEQAREYYIIHTMQELVYLLEEMKKQVELFQTSYITDSVNL
jgi:hypothetical protein